MFYLKQCICSCLKKIHKWLAFQKVNLFDNKSIYYKVLLHVCVNMYTCLLFWCFRSWGPIPVLIPTPVPATVAPTGGYRMEEACPFSIILLVFAGAINNLLNFEIMKDNFQSHGKKACWFSKMKFAMLVRAINDL